jgi:hypothetical protein
VLGRWSQARTMVSHAAASVACDCGSATGSG